ncbi:hypothetical protein ILUMI_22031 [Ignelater luminosus]|uniref:Uncharacterized protein n=1 Tax=Ignelater luminosus TaxID=2038154 RepID=A0A8K0G0W5_IGNLU|nr:hypothetical protein ILUMI_22031 [Ignelater luminosus]
MIVWRSAYALQQLYSIRHDDANKCQLTYHNLLFVIHAALDGYARTASDDQYKRAWDLLCHRFGNERLLTDTHIKSIFNLENLHKESYTQFRSMLDEVSEYFSALEGHFKDFCQLGSCKKCKQKHNTVLHKNNTANKRDNGNSAYDSISQTNTQPKTEGVQTSTNFLVKPKVSETQVLLSTVVLQVKDVKDQLQACKALLDSGSTKHHLKRLMLNTNLASEEFNTLLTQIEGILNSRPLFALSNKPYDLQPLTPSQFFIGRVLSNPPGHDLEQVNVNRFSRW